MKKDSKNIRRSKKNQGARRWKKYFISCTSLIIVGWFGWLGHKYLHHLPRIRYYLTEKKDYLPVTPSPRTKVRQAIPRLEFHDITASSALNVEDGYELEVATYSDFAQADSLKASLTLSGFVVSITPLFQQGGRRYQVCVGPFSKLEEVQAMQKKLKRFGLRGKLKRYN